MGALWHEQAHRQTDDRHTHIIYIKHFNFSKVSGKIKGLLNISKTVFSYIMNMIDSGKFGFVVPVFIVNSPWFLLLSQM